MKSIIYQHPHLYHAAERILYGGKFKRRYELVAEHIKKGWHVLDLCCGDCYLTRFLDKSIDYEGWDFNSKFIRYAKARNIKAFCRNLRDRISADRKFDCVIMMSSLYHFIPYEDKHINAMKTLALKRVIISEPVKSPVLSSNRCIQALAQIISGTEDKRWAEMKRFSRDELINILNRHGVTKIIDVDKDLMGIFDI